MSASSKIVRLPPKVATTTAAYPSTPVRQYSFTNNSINNPSSQQPGNNLDSEYDRSNASIAQIIAWTGVSLNTDGTLRTASVGSQQIAPGVFDSIASDAIAEIQPLVDQAHSFSTSAQASSASATTAAANAQTSATVSASAATNAQNSSTSAASAASSALASSNAASTYASDTSNDANHATGSANAANDYAVAAQAWAEYMPDIIPPNILAVMGVTGDHWSARWWANHADQTVSTALDELNQALTDALGQIEDAGNYWLGVLQDQTEQAIQGIQSLYLGAFYSPPVADSLGNPIATGAMYFDLTLDAAYVWNGATWRPLVTPGPSAIFRYVYVATAGQTVFTGADRNGNVFQYNHANYQALEVFKAGALLTPVNDYTEGINTVTLVVGATAGQIVQLLVESVPKVALEWQTIRLDTSAWTTTGGVLIDAANSTAVTPNAPTDVMLSVSGVWQASGRDYTVAGNLLTLTTPAQPGALMFGLVIVPVQTPSVPVPGLTLLDVSTWTFDGTTTAFPLRDTLAAPVTPPAPVNLLVSLNGIWQAAERDYTVTGSTVTFLVPPLPGSIAFALSGLPALP